MNIQLTQYAWFKPRRVIGITLSVAILFAPFPSLAQENCIQQITYGKDPTTDQWKQFSTPCDVPTDWESLPTLPEGASLVEEVDNKDTTGSEDTTGSPSLPTTTTETPANSGTDTTPTTTIPTELPTESTGTGTTTNTPSPTNPPTDASAACPAQITYAKPSETSQKWYLFSTSCDVPDGWLKADKVCAEVVVYAQNPTSKNWYSFVTPCDVPTDWTEISYIKPENTELTSGPGCTTDVKYAQNLKTTHWYLFGLSCDVPSGVDWKIDTAQPQNGVNIIVPKISESNQCPPTLTYAQHPTSEHWYAFATPCDVPATWEKIGVVQQEEASTGESCEAFYASYSAEGNLTIPIVKFNNWLFKDIGLRQVGGIESFYFLFAFDIDPLPMPTETKQ